jgi:predicted ATP-grasp superfamily ATP-dependent carboligase
VSADLLILGASARAAAFSALRAGLRPISIDLFADRDLAAVAVARRVGADAYPEGLAAVASTAVPAPWIYTGGLENHPDLVDRLAAARPLWGISGSALRAVRDPIAVATVLRRAGLPVPAVRATPAGLPRDGSWLAKPLASAGGAGIVAVGPGWVDREAPTYYQERIDGPSFSAVFVGERGGAKLLGVTTQLLGRPGAPFAYRGSVGPCELGSAAERRIATLGRALAHEFRLIGLFGVDFILKDGHPWPVEVNPRLTASVEVLELALGRPSLAEHRRACDPTAPPAPIVPAEGIRSRVVGKAIVFAEGRCQFPATDDLGDGRVAGVTEDGNPGPDRHDPGLPRTATRATRFFEVPEIADVPDPGVLFEASEPVLTVFATGHDLRSCRQRLDQNIARWRRLLIP